PTSATTIRYDCHPSALSALSGDISPDKRVSPPDRLATRITTAVTEILERPNSPRRQRSYPWVLKRAGRQKLNRKTLAHKNINHNQPPGIRLHQHVT
ncbi:hypothetical protein, partial [Nocardia amamiensis]|uniref:hypothetical protein n=1 Tax=Nocardia amamiensis TaxID=404578 RepID=UPI000A863FA3